MLDYTKKDYSKFEVCIGIAVLTFGLNFTLFLPLVVTSPLPDSLMRFLIQIGPEVSMLSLQPFFQSLAIVQTSVLSIIIAIYALSTQIAADRFTTRILSSVNENVFYRRLVLLFTGSIFVDLLALLIYPVSPSWLVWAFVIVAVLGVISTFGSLFYLKEELLSTTEAKSVASAIDEGIGKESFKISVEGDETTIPYYNFFEATRSTIEEEDKDAANKLITAICSSLTGLFECLYSSADELSERETIGLVQILTEMKSLAAETMNKEYDELTGHIFKNMSEIINTSIEYGQASVAARGIQACSDISEDVIKQSRLIKPAWLMYEEILISAARKGQEKTIQVGTTSVSNLIDVSIENRDVIDERNLTISRILMSAYLQGWETLVSNYGGYISEDDRVDEVPEFLWYRFFERNFEITARMIVSHNDDLQIPAAGMYKLRKKMIEGLTDVAISAARIPNSYLALRLSKMVIEVGLGFDDKKMTREEIKSGLAEIRSTNDCGEQAVYDALSELQTPAEVSDDDDGLPIEAPWLLNFIGYTFEGQEEFIDAVVQIEDELLS